jgi:hypothetical protein
LNRDLLCASGVLASIIATITLLAFIEAQVGYERFAWGGILLCLGLTVGAAGATAISVRRDLKQEHDNDTESGS